MFTQITEKIIEVYNNYCL